MGTVCKGLGISGHIEKNSWIRCRKPCVKHCNSKTNNKNDMSVLNAHSRFNKTVLVMITSFKITRFSSV